MASSTIYVIVTAEALARPPAGWKPCLAQTGTLCCLQGFGPLLTEALLQYGVIGTDKRGEAQPAPSRAAAYSSTGLPLDDAPLLTSQLLDLVVYGVHQPEEWLFFAQAALLPCMKWFLAFVQLSMRDRPVSCGSCTDLVRSYVLLTGKPHLQSLGVCLVLCTHWCGV